MNLEPRVITNPVPIVHTNSDGMGALPYHLANAAMRKINGVEVFGSAPADDSSGSGCFMWGPSFLEADRFNEKPRRDRLAIKHYETQLPLGAPPNGVDPNDEALTYVTGSAVEAASYGLGITGPNFFGKGRDIQLLVSGPNIGHTTGWKFPMSATAGAAAFAAHNRVLSHDYHVLGVAFSMWKERDPEKKVEFEQLGWGDKNRAPKSMTVAAEGMKDVVQALVRGTSPIGGPILPRNVWLNVNFPGVATHGCDNAKRYKYVLARSGKRPEKAQGEDYDACGNTPAGSLPLEKDVVKSWSDKGNDCYVPIVILDASTKYEWNFENAITAKTKRVYEQNEHNVEYGPALIARQGSVPSGFTSGYDPLENWFLQAPTQDVQKEVYQKLDASLPGGLHCLLKRA